MTAMEMFSIVAQSILALNLCVMLKSWSWDIPRIFVSLKMSARLKCIVTTCFVVLVENKYLVISCPDKWARIGFHVAVDGSTSQAHIYPRVIHVAKYKISELE